MEPLLCRVRLPAGSIILHTLDHRLDRVFIRQKKTPPLLNQELGTRKTVAYPEMRERLRGPSEAVFAEGDFEPAFGGKQIDGQAAFPQRDHQRKRIALTQAQQLARDGNLEDAIAGGEGQ